MPQAERCWAPSRTLTSLVGDKLDGMSAEEGGRGLAHGAGGKVTKPTSVLRVCMGCWPSHSLQEGTREWPGVTAGQSWGCAWGGSEGI